MEFDGQFVRRCEPVRDLMDEFVRVRVTDMRGLDLSRFRFDWDLTLAVFFLSADGTIYGRFGTRSDFKESERDISFPGLRMAMRTALRLHRDREKHAESLAGKTPPKPRYRRVEDYPWTKDRHRRDGCVSCHIVSIAERHGYRTAGKTIPDAALFPWPMPDVVGLTMDPLHKGTVKEVAEDSAAARAGFRAGDVIRLLDGQEMLSTADIQWVLERSGDGPAEIAATIIREGKSGPPLTLKLDAGWRRASNISWRTTTWSMRATVTGRMSLRDLPDEDRKKLGLSDDALALRVVGPMRRRFEAWQAGFRMGDVIVGFGEAKGRLTEGGLLGWAMNHTKPGQTVPVTVIRGDRNLSLRLTAK